jgi:hypothetical protein
MKEGTMRNYTKQSLQAAAVLILVSTAATCRRSNLPSARETLTPETLGTTVEAFMNTWLRIDPLAGQLLAPYPPSETERVRTLRVGAFIAKPAGSSSDMLIRRLDSLASETPSGEMVIVPTTTDAIADMVPVLKERHIELKPLAGSQTLAYPVRTWEGISWTGSAGPSQRALFEDVSRLERHPFWGVIAQVRTPDDVIVPMLLLWQEQPEDGSPPSWKLVTMFPIQAQ